MAGASVVAVASACQVLPGGWTVVQDAVGNGAATVTAGAGAGNVAATVSLSGSPVTGMSATQPSPLTPAFSPGTGDYTVRCPKATGNTVTLSATSSSGPLTFEGLRARPLTVTVTGVAANQAVMVTEGSSQWWVRCLPPDFPALSVTAATGATPGWFLFGNVTGDTRGPGTGTYAMVLDGNGTPVWYEKVPGGPTNVTSWAPDTVAWAQGGPQAPSVPVIEMVQDLASMTSQHLTAPEGVTDAHDIVRDSSGDLWMLADEPARGTDLSKIGKGTNQTVLDCVVEKVSPAGTVQWTWRASQHIAPAESESALFDWATFGGQNLADIYHCNSIDLSADGSQLLLSFRNTAAVYDVSIASGAISWKLGGNSVTKDGERVLRISGDPEQTISGQHDARFRPNGDVSLFDDHTGLLGAARGIEYAVDPARGTARMVWEYASPDGQASQATGGTRREADGTSVICWGFHPSSGFTEVSATGKPLLHLTFPNGAFPYRAIEVPPSQFDVSVLRASVWQEAGTAS